MQGLSLEAMRRFVRDTRAGATAIAAAAVTVMTVGGAALISDHAWLVDQRDVLKTAADAAGIAATLEMTRLAGEAHTDDELKEVLKPIVLRYILLNLEHLSADPRVSDGLSLTLPGTALVPAFMYPDTNRLDPALIAQVRQTIFDDFSAHGVEESLGADGVDQLLRERGDNPWDRAGRGPNYHCTWTAVLPLSSDREEVNRVLDSLYDTSRNPVLMGGVTMSHLGLTWGRRMLAPSWRTVWGDDAHPVEPAETVTKALVLLTDGQNGAHSDGWGELPGRLSARYDTVADEIVFGCDSRRVAGCGILRGEHAYRNDYASRYTAVGRFGEGRAEDGFPVAGQDFGRASTGTQAQERLRDLLRHSCELAHEEGLVVYTVSLLSPSQSISQGWKAQLVACSGNSETTTDAEREEYYLQGTDSASLEAAFREIGERLITVRRTS